MGCSTTTMELGNLKYGFLTAPFCATLKTQEYVLPSPSLGLVPYCRENVTNLGGSILIDANQFREHHQSASLVSFV